MNKIVDKMKNYLDKSVEVSKDTIGKAGDVVQEFGDKSITKVEKIQLEQKLKREYLELGKKCYEIIGNDNNFSGLATDISIADLIVSIKTIKSKMDNCVLESKSK